MLAYTGHGNHLSYFGGASIFYLQIIWHPSQITASFERIWIAHTLHNHKNKQIISGGTTSVILNILFWILPIWKFKPLVIRNIPLNPILSLPDLCYPQNETCIIVASPLHTLTKANKHQQHILQQDRAWPDPNLTINHQREISKLYPANHCLKTWNRGFGIAWSVKINKRLWADYFVQITY